MSTKGEKLLMLVKGLPSLPRKPEREGPVLGGGNNPELWLEEYNRSEERYEQELEMCRQELKPADDCINYVKWLRDIASDEEQLVVAVESIIAQLSALRKECEFKPFQPRNFPVDSFDF